MAEISSQGFAMGYPAKEASEFVALDIANLGIAADGDSSSTSSPRVIKIFSRKGSLRVGAESKNVSPAAPSAMEGDATALLPIIGERNQVSVHVACPEDTVAVSHVVTQISAGTTKYRRLGSRRASAPWLDPRRVLFAFATLSSMGTLILLYLTLSMGKMHGESPP